MERLTIEELLARSRRRLHRLDPPAAHQALGRGAILVDIRLAEQIESDGAVPGALLIPRNVVE